MTCRSPNSAQPDGVNIKQITVNFVDECWDAQLSKPVIMPASYTMELFTYGFASYSQSTSTLPCPISQELIERSQPNPISQNAADLEVDFKPMSRDDHLGSFNYFIRSCVQVENTLTNCIDSEDAQVIVTDPCVNTLPYTESI